MSDIKPHRRTWDGGDAPLAEMPLFGWGDHMRVLDHDLEPHSHRALEITLFVRGGAQWWVGREMHDIGPGDLFITRAGEVHGGADSLLHRCEILWLQLRIPKLRAAGGEARRLANSIAAIDSRQFPASPAIERLFRQMYAELVQPGRFRELTLRASLYALLVQMLADHDRAIAKDHARGRRISPRIAKSLEWIEQHLADDFLIEEVAAAVGMSVSWFHETFVAEVGYSPGDYRTRVRARHAKKLLAETDWPITQIAMELGYTTSQYFATQFRKEAGFGPREYRKRLAARAVAPP